MSHPSPSGCALSADRTAKPGLQLGGDRRCRVSGSLGRANELLYLVGATIQTRLRPAHLKLSISACTIPLPPLSDYRPAGAIPGGTVICNKCHAGRPPAAYHKGKRVGRGLGIAAPALVTRRHRRRRRRKPRHPCSGALGISPRATTDAKQELRWAGARAVSRSTLLRRSLYLIHAFTGI